MALKECRECGEPVSTGAKTCPHCGVNNPTFQQQMIGCFGSGVRSIAALGCLTILAAGGFIFFKACGAGFQAMEKAQKEMEERQAALKVKSFEWTRGDFGNRYLTGTLVNESDNSFAYVQIQFNLYDESGAQVGSTMTNVNNVEPHGSWQFKAIVMERSATRAKLMDVTGF